MLKMRNKIMADWLFDHFARLKRLSHCRLVDCLIHVMFLNPVYFFFAINLIGWLLSWGYLHIIATVAPGYRSARMYTCGKSYKSWHAAILQDSAHRCSLFWRAISCRPSAAALNDLMRVPLIMGICSFPWCGLDQHLTYDSSPSFLKLFN